MILNDIFTLPTSRPDLEACTKFGTPGAFAGPRHSRFSISTVERSDVCLTCNVGCSLLWFYDSTYDLSSCT